MTTPSTSTHETHLRHLNHCITLAQQSPPKPTNYRVGCVIVSHNSTSSTSSRSSSEVVATGYTLETPGNTHAEQNALSKLSLSQSPPPANQLTLYTSLEPCSLRLSGNTPCVQRIISSGIRHVIFGAKEPNTFVTDSQSCKLLTEAGVKWEYIPDLEEEILRVAMEGHSFKKEEQKSKDKDEADEGAMKNESVFLHDRVDAMANDTNKNMNNDMNSNSNSEATRKLQEAEAQPRNPKKRMMETI